MFAAKNVLFTKSPLSTVLPVAVRGANAAQAGTVTIPAHAVGDIIVIYAFTTGNTVPSKPAASGTVPAWVDIDANTGANNVSSRTAYFVATATNHTSGTWASTDLIAVVLRGQGATPIGGHAESGGTSGVGNTVAPAITLSQTDGTSAILDFHGSDQVEVSFGPWPAAPSGYTRRAASGSALADGACANSKNDTTSDGSIVQYCDADSIDYRGATVEIRAH